MIKIRKSESRGHAQHGWLESFHTFSFADYYAPEHMNFRNLRVINEDFVQPSGGFATHSHHDMEIITYVLDGALEHKDSLGNGSVIRPGDVQLMSAGTGVTHSEYNPSQEDLVHLLQIWILPDRKGLAPSYAERHFPLEQRRNTLRVLVSPDGRDDSLRIHTDASILAAILEPGHAVTHELAFDRHAWVQVARGQIQVNGHPLAGGDAAAVSEESNVEILADSPAEIILFDLN